MSKKIDVNILKLYMTGGASPSNDVKFSKAGAEVDLHVDSAQFKNGKRGEQYAIEHQLEIFEKALDAAVAAGKWELRIIHGNGSGKLKTAIHQMLKKNRFVKSFNSDYHPKYGFGSTVVYFQ
ncbi:MAG: Smr/MutS family protein [Chitinophagales bacterium]